MTGRNADADRSDESTHFVGDDCDPPHPDPMTELVRLSEALGLYDAPVFYDPSVTSAEENE